MSARVAYKVDIESDDDGLNRDAGMDVEDPTPYLGQTCGEKLTSRRVMAGTRYREGDARAWSDFAKRLLTILCCVLDRRLCFNLGFFGREAATNYKVLDSVLSDPAFVKSHNFKEGGIERYFSIA
jgi:hypothetical protein